MTRKNAVLVAAGFIFFVTGAALAADIPRAEHPRPDFRRDDWLNLNGPWQFRFDPEDRGLRDEWWQPSASFDRRINVPFCWESKLSGIQDTSGQKTGWYRRELTVPAGFRGKRVWLRFGAVDWQAHVWVNGKQAGQHEGGYTPFEFDITDLVEAGKPAAIVVRAFDATDRELPVGKQLGWYTPTSGIWQTVWLEARPPGYIDRLSLIPRHEGGEWSLDVSAVIRGSATKFRAASPDESVEKREIAVTGPEVRSRLKVKDAKPWSPDSPHLYDLVLQLESPGGAVDVVHTYFGLRTIGRGKYQDQPYESVLLNGKPVYLRGALDQSFSPDGAYTAPNDEFFRRDMELAKSLGLNFLRIHIKVDEPRRLYWADRAGVLIMEDMPNTYRNSERGRKPWEMTMLDTIERDRNHPSIISWCLFNETWGLGNLKSSADSQSWVLRMWESAKRLDPTRLVDDNSANKFDHVKSDLNSGHFYTDNYAWGRAHIDSVIRLTRPGSPYNYVPGRTQDGAPLINGEYGPFPSGGGDRDVSWAFRFLTTQLRRHEKMQGYTFTELYDLEWEHNGFTNYDRSPKEFGYDAFVPGMTVRDLQGEDFVGFDAPPAIRAKAGGEITVPVFVSHYSQRGNAPLLRWWLAGTDDLGRPFETKPENRKVEWRRYRVTTQEPVRMRIPAGRAFLGAIGMELVDEKGARIAANFVNVIARPAGESGCCDDPAPRVEVLGPRQVALRFRPDEFSDFLWPDAGRSITFPGKFHAFDSGFVEYRVTLPGFVRDAGPARLELLAELASKARSERMDWPSRNTRTDYPQTDGRKHRGAVNITVAGETLETFVLPDDPADSRGVLSHLVGTQHGSYGYLFRKTLDPAAKHVRDGVIAIRFEVPPGPQAKGLSIYGETMGRYVFDPTVIVNTDRDLARPAGWTSAAPVVVQREE